MNAIDNHPRVKDTIIDALVGGYIGGGTYRDVYALKCDPAKVIKVETRGKSFSNVHEMAIWEELKGTKWEKWLAPIYYIDAYGVSMIQARTIPLRRDEWRLLKRLPSIFTDLKPANFGMFEGRVVAHDFGNHQAFSLALANMKMVEIQADKHDPERHFS